MAGTLQEDSVGPDDVLGLGYEITDGLDRFQIGLEVVCATEDQVIHAAGARPGRVNPGRDL